MSYMERMWSALRNDLIEYTYKDLNRVNARGELVGTESLEKHLRLSLPTQGAWHTSAYVSIRQHTSDMEGLKKRKSLSGVSICTFVQVSASVFVLLS